MKKSIIYFICIIGIITMISNGCKKDCNDPSNPNCSNFDPCLNVADATFTVKQYCRSFFNEAFFEEDTFLTPGFLVFEVNDIDIDSCYWKVGAENQIRRGKSIKITFDNPMEELLPVQLIAYKNLECCQDQLAQWDTVTQYIPLEHQEETRIIGSYTGYHEDAPNDTFTVIIDSLSHPFNNYVMYGIFNLPEGCIVDNSFFEYENFAAQPSIVPSKTNFLFYTSFTDDECPNPKGVGKIDQINNSIIIDYSISLGIDPVNGGIIREDKKFIGQKN